MKRNPWRVILPIITIILAAGLLAFLFMQRKDHTETSQKLSEMQAEAKPYEEELETLKNTEPLTAVSIEAPEEASVLVAYTATYMNDLNLIETYHHYANIPYILINVADGVDGNLLSVIAEKGYSVILGADPFTEENFDAVLAAKEEIEQAGITVATIFSITDDDITAENLQLVQSAGFNVFTNNSVDLEEYEITTDLVSFHRLVMNESSKENTKNFSSGEYYLLVIDLRSTWDHETLLQTKTEVVDKLLSGKSVAELDADSYFAELAQQEEQIAYNKEHAEELETERQAQIKELEDKISQIYNGWK